MGGASGKGPPPISLKQWAYEVGSLGASGLDKRARKAFEANRLVQLGGAVAKTPRIPANIGIGMAK